MAVMVYNLKNFYISPHNISHTLLPWPENLLTDKEVLASLLGNFLWSFKYNNNHWPCPAEQHNSVLIPSRVSGNVPPSEENVSSAATYPSGVPRELSLILKEIKVITDKIRDDEESTAIESDWKFAAMVLDRLCLITFTLFTIIATLAVLAAAPHVIVK